MDTNIDNCTEKVTRQAKSNVIATVLRAHKLRDDVSFFIERS